MPVWVSSVPCHRLQRDHLQCLDSPEVWERKAGSGVHHFNPVYFCGASVEMSDVSYNPVLISRSFMPWPSESAYTN